MTTDEYLVRTVDGMVEFPFPVTELDGDELLELNDSMIMELQEAMRENNYMAERSVTILLTMVSGEIINRVARSYMQSEGIDDL